jgi:hypothetical protein
VQSLSRLPWAVAANPAGPSGLRSEISLKINGLFVGTPDTQAESMLCERFVSAAVGLDLATVNFQGAKGWKIL